MTAQENVEKKSVKRLERGQTQKGGRENKEKVKRRKPLRTPMPRKKKKNPGITPIKQG